MKYFCSKDCPDTCAFDLATAPDGSPVFTPAHRPEGTAPFLCAKLRSFYEVESSPEPGAFFVEGGRRVSASADEAVSQAAALIRKHAGGRILFLRGSGSLAWRMSAWDALFSRMPGVWFVAGSPCDETGITAHTRDFSVCLNPDVVALAAADAIVLFGKNAKVASPHLYAYLKRLSGPGRPILVVDPVKTDTCRIADRHIRIHPGGDGALAAAILSRLDLETGLDWESLRADAGVCHEDFEALCTCFGGRGKTAVITGFGLQRYANGMNSVRWINRLAVLTGNEDLLYYGKSSKEGLESPGIHPAHSVPIAQLPDKLRENFFDLIMIVGANPCVTYPESAVWLKAMAGTPVITADVRHTATTAHAEVFLRVSGMFGQEDVQGSYFFRDGIRIRPRGPLTRHPSDADTAGMLAGALGIALDIKKAVDVGRTQPQLKRRYACEGLRVRPPIRLPGYRLLTVSHPLYLNSQVPPGVAEWDHCLFVSEAVAEAEGLRGGELLRVKNDIGFFEAPCRVTPMLSGPVVMVHKNREMRRNWPNHVTRSRATDAGNGLNYYDTFVRLEKMVGSPDSP